MKIYMIKQKSSNHDCEAHMLGNEEKNYYNFFNTFRIKYA